MFPSTNYTGGAVPNWDPKHLTTIPGFSPLRKKLNALQQIKIAENHTATGIDHGALGRQDHLHRLLDLPGMPILNSRAA